jgi:asparagine synthetase B (glutamine-hydrolysing)
MQEKANIFAAILAAMTQRVKIVMSGEGADELLAGYARYLVLVREQALYEIPELRLYNPHSAVLTARS